MIRLPELCIRAAIAVLLASFVQMERARGQVSVDFSGYVADFLVCQRIHGELPGMLGADRNQLLNITRARFRPTMNLWPGAFLALEYEVHATYHSSVMQFPEVSGRRPRQLFDLTRTIVKSRNFSAVHTIDRLYLRHSSDLGDMTIGRQRIAWGSGRIWNPTDLFNPINPAHFAKIEKDGVDAATVKVRFASFTDLMLVVNPQARKSTNAGLRFRTNYSGFDCSLLAGRFDNHTVFGIDLAGNLFDAGVRCEWIANAREDTKGPDFTSWIVGVDYQFTSDLYALTEFHHNGDGSNQTAQYELGRLYSGEMVNLGRQYVAASASYIFHPFATGTLSTTLNLNDRSWFAGLAITYSIADEISASLGGQIFAGERLSEFWYYPNTLYTKVDLYF